MRTRTILVVYGTRPEAIKMAPVVQALETSPHFEPVVAVTGQHREMLDQVNALFGISPRHDLDIIQPRQELHDITMRALGGLTDVMRAERPDAVIVQGDTTTSFIAALAAFYLKTPVVHVEAGLRTHDRHNPFPEEINRRLTSQLASVHLAPTPISAANLRAEGVEDADIVVTGNTVIDALLDVVRRDLPRENQDLRVLDEVPGRQIVLVTSHRRESWGEPMACTARAIARLARDLPGVLFLLPAHLNPAVREVLLPPVQGLQNVLVTDPLSYGDFAGAMRASAIMLTDSGGVQEEAPSLGKPVLVLRDTTERPEAVDAGTVRLVGTDEDLIVKSTATLLTDPVAYREMSRAVNPYGDGLAAGRVVGAIEHYFDVGPRPVDFDPSGEVAP
ncbi:UDP-N-acetylglucosamine 2-epimerase (non-hydrolyzing) [Aeromicrobium sp. S22]|uniref:non-hydrolyzing UDP-N-acetylglucosamine 2-epimerase n=1 Tax=Aeromicrobium sp. S22 TaxID=2662029 RepID=UPI00129DD01D|nr:UDP-N-acetylglucosamine 2-epimerase (non-hydrolyzing) [Aeromicrobium sp. S22]MRK00827.1 UDP-N-acetylglucosamine 2-epimerase (non-hydrolyzing) [Aeromicrobium sp. S22]